MGNSSFSHIQKEGISELSVCHLFQVSPIFCHLGWSNLFMPNISLLSYMLMTHKCLSPPTCLFPAEHSHMYFNIFTTCTSHISSHILSQPTITHLIISTIFSCKSDYKITFFLNQIISIIHGVKNKCLFEDSLSLRPWEIVEKMNLSYTLTESYSFQATLCPEDMFTAWDLRFLQRWLPCYSCAILDTKIFEKFNNMLSSQASWGRVRLHSSTRSYRM